MRNEQGDNAVRLLGVNNDGRLDVVIADDEEGITRLWHPASKT